MVSSFTQYHEQTQAGLDDRRFQNEVIVRIGKKWAPAKADGVLLSIGAQIVEHIFNEIWLEPESLCLANRYGLVFHQQSG